MSLVRSSEISTLWYTSRGSSTAVYDSCPKPAADMARPSAEPICHGPGPRNFSRGTFANASTNPDRKSTRLNSSHLGISYAVFCLKKKILIEVPVVLRLDRTRDTD